MVMSDEVIEEGDS